MKNHMVQSVLSKNVASNITIVSDSISNKISTYFDSVLMFFFDHHRKLCFWIELNTPSDSLFYEGYKNAYFAGDRN